MKIIIELQTLEDYILNLKGKLIVDKFSNYVIDFKDKRLFDCFYYGKSSNRLFFKSPFSDRRICNYFATHIFPLYYPTLKVKLW